MKRRGMDAQLLVIKDFVEVDADKAETARELNWTSSFKVNFEQIAETFERTFAAAARTQDANSLRQTALAFHNYESAYGKLPAPVMVSESGKKYSWRIAILPFIEQRELYDQYDFDQEWDSPHNRRVTAQMPDVFRSSSDDQDSTYTSWFMLTGPEGLGDGVNGSSFSDITDGTSNTALAVEAKRKVHWAKPEDIRIEPGRPVPQLGGFHEGGFNIAMADGSVRFVSDKVAPDVLRALFTKGGQEIFDHKALDGANDEDDE